MAKMLDLSVFTENYFTVKLIDGTELRLKKPSQKLLMRLMAVEKMGNQSVEEQMETINSVTTEILNNNINGKVFSAEEVSNYDVIIQKAIIEGYSEFLNEVMSNPN